MKRLLLSAAVLLGLTTLPVYAAKDCNELKTEIGAKIEANGVKNYDLTIVKTEEVKADDKVVGGCGGGTMKIVYVRKESDSATKDAPTKK